MGHEFSVLNLISGLDLEDNTRRKDTCDPAHEGNSRDYLMHKRNLQPQKFKNKSNYEGKGKFEGKSKTSQSINFRN